MLIDPNTFSLKKLLNRYKGVTSYKRGASINTGYPVEAILEITNYCNLACIMCPRENMTRPLGFMKINLFKKIIDEVKNYIEWVDLSGGLGDPMLHPEYPEMVKYAKKNNVRIGISTNAAMFTKRHIDTLLDLQPDIIRLSLDGATKETHEKIRVGSKFEKTMSMVENFVIEKEKRNLKKPYVVCQMVYMPENKKEADAFQKKWNSFSAVDDTRLKKYMNLYGANQGPEEAEEDHSKLSCILPWRQLSVHYDGAITICCRDTDSKVIVGNVTDVSVKEVWNSPQMIEYRNNLSNEQKSKISVCKDCNTIKTNSITRLGAILVDAYSIRKMLPYLEKLVLKTGVPLDYE